MNIKKIHKIADEMGVKWDKDPEFMSWTEKLTGKRHLDDMNQEELELIAYALKKGDKPGRRISGFWRFTHPDPKMNDDDASRQPYGLGI